ncbi:MAG: [FeFe] hydrogenase H-cluster radical SAM maturase HydE [Desulfuromonadales bacterium]|nr:MAG: [FeFe] hydrogenase H-cluster radical SAM maturase HydE [Desulfuromonadales bacterium]
MRRDMIVDWLKTEDPSRLEELWQWADETRRCFVGEEVHLRGLLEISNICARQCHYCGLRAENTRIRRYRMTEEEILACARQAVAFGYGTVVLQGGEDPGIEANWMAGVIRRIKGETPLAVTLSLGERSDDDFALWREAGADRYLLRFETANRNLYEAIHPSSQGRHSDRLAMLRTLKKLGYEIGSGIMIGIPGQSYEDLAGDIEMFCTLDLDMIGVGPFIAHPDTPLGQAAERLNAAAGEQVPNSEAMTYKVMALARLVCPAANIPATTALATLNLERGRELGLVRGGNIVMPNLTPQKYRAMYEIYPAKACIDETADQCRACMAGRIRSIGRTVGVGRGDSPKRTLAA